jgi:type IV pilus assembly protein PilY1
VNSDNFTVRWLGQVEARWDGEYTFYVRSDDGARLWIAGQLLVDKWQDQSATEWPGTITLQAEIGRAHV